MRLYLHVQMLLKEWPASRSSRLASFAMDYMELDEVLKQYAQQLRRFFASRVRNPADADDLVQEVFLKTLSHFQRIQEPEKFRSWLFAVARNALVDHYRKSAKYMNKDLSSTAAALEVPMEVDEELSKCIRPFLKQRPNKYRHVMEAVEMHDKPQKQVAQEMGIAYSTLKSRVQRGRKMLSDLFRACCQYEFDRSGGILDFKAKMRTCDSCGSIPPHN